MTKSEKLLLTLFDSLEIDIFSIESLQKVHNINLIEWRIPFKGLINKSYFDIIEKGKYCRHNFRDEYVIGNYLAPEGAIAYWSALNLHGMTEQISNTVFVQSPKLKTDKTVFGVRYQFVKVKSTKIVGIETSGYGNHSYKITDQEKTIIDCFDLPEYGGEFPGIIRAFVSNDWNEQKLIQYAKQVNNVAAMKRMGYLAEIFDLPLKDFIDFAKNKVTKTISLFDNAQTDMGTYITDWGLRMNIEKEDILSFKYY